MTQQSHSMYLLVEVKTYIYTEGCFANVYSSFIYVAKTRKQPKYSSTDERINRLWYIHATEYYSAIKNKTKEWTTETHSNMDKS